MQQPWSVTALTLFPEMFPGPLASSLVGRALEKDLWRLEAVDIRGFARDKHRRVDDTPAGGGAGMVMRADVLGKAIDAHWSEASAKPLLYMSPRGEPLTQGLVREFASGPGAVVICGRFEGIDERILKARPVRQVSLGDFILSGGEIAALALMDAVVRLLPGVVGQEASLVEESFETGLLEYPHYTRPPSWEGLSIPEVLLSGHHGEIAAWRRAQAEEITRAQRPDLWKRYKETQKHAAKKEDM